MVGPVGRHPAFPPQKPESDSIRHLSIELIKAVQAFCECIKSVQENKSLVDNPEFLQNFANQIRNLYPLARKAQGLPGE